MIDAHLHYSGFLAELLLAHGVTTAFDIGGRGLYQGAHSADTRESARERALSALAGLWANCRSLSPTEQAATFVSPLSLLCTL
jgi:hypothetical protein